ncbi:cytochrome P450 [Coprinellus micaceus]|uniref:Cytochrome P450 n=1 Tax=Coprinellus micaceus TaxID=71717 RepID=A0A4Y7SCI2_COPMI|nr:cytochrome P450 [Coprinellus micaceus]
MYEQAFASPLQLLSIGIGAWGFWRVLRSFLFKDPLAVIPGPPSASWPLGDLPKLFDKRPGNYQEDLFKKYGRTFRITGLFKESLLVVSDPKALYRILIKDQDIFEESDDTVSPSGQDYSQPLATASPHSFHTDRINILDPVFSAAYMRDNTPVFCSVVHKLENSIEQLVGSGEKEIDLLSWMTRTALELVAQSGLGYTFDTLEPHASEHPYATSIRNWVGTVNDPVVTVIRFLLYPYVYNIGGPRFQRTVVNVLPWKKLHAIRDMVDVMHKTSIDIFENAKRGLDKGDDARERIAKGKDIMSALLKANMLASEGDKLPDEELIAQVSTLTFAAMDTTSNALSRILYLLSEHPEVQERLRGEVTQAYTHHGGDMDYETLNALPYLDAVCRESLRVYTPAPFVTRQARKDAVVPLATPITTTEGREINELFVPKDTLLFIALGNCNRDPLIWGPEATEWKPERWLSPQPESVTQARIPGVYSNLMTFLGGGRSCIGFKFSQLEMKIVLSVLLAKVKFAPSGKNIVWLSNGIVQPAVEDPKRPGSGETELQLPLKVSLVAE